MRLSIHATILLCLLALSFSPVVSAVSAVDSLTRGNMFTVSIAGRPVTGYYVWFTRTYALSGEPGDQPPVIVSNQYHVEFDPEGGPYTIGSYMINNGNGRTILDDVAPSSSTTSNTRYYAKVITDSDGYGIVQFSTSSATADKTFTIRAENPAAPGEEVPVSLGLPQKTKPVTTATIVPVTSAPTSFLTTPETPVPVLTTGSIPASLPETPVGTVTAVNTKPAPTQASPGMAIPLLAACLGIFLMRRSS